MDLQDRLDRGECCRYDPDHFEEWLERALDDACIIKTNKKIKYYSAACSFDIETSSFYAPNGSKQCCMYLWGFSVRGLVLYGRTWEEWLQLCAQLSDLLELSDEQRLLVYVHNLAYEFQFMRRYFIWENVFSLDERKPVYALCTLGIEFRCSYILSGYSLEKLGDELQHYHIKKLVGALDYSKLRHPGTKITEQELRYQINDVNTVVAYIEECIEAEYSIAQIPITKTGYVRRYCRTACLYDKKKKNGYKDNTKYHRYMRIMKNCLLDADEYKQLKRAFMGGFTHCSAFCSGKIFEQVASFDFCSSYPAQMISKKYPMHTGELIKVKSIKEAELNMRLYCCLFDVKITGLIPKIIYDHPLSRSKCYGIKGLQEDNGRVVCADELYTTLTEQDYYTLKDFYLWDSIEFGTFRRYRKGYLPTDFVKAILELYRKKTELKGVEGKEAEFVVNKGMLNACYGMAVTDIVKPDILYGTDWEEVEELSLQDISKRISKYNNSRRRFLFYPWGIWVTAYSRRALFQGIAEFGSDYIYSDTDSIKAINAERHLGYIEQYNDFITWQLRKACDYHGLSYDLIEPKTIKGKKKPLGIWEYEGTYSRFKALRAKCYMTEEAGEISLTVSGVNKKTAVPWMLKKYKDNTGAFAAFSDELFIPAEATGKNTHTYIDEEMEGTLTDYMGKPGYYHELSGVHLSGADYSLSLSQIYRDYIRGVQYE